MENQTITDPSGNVLRLVGKAKTTAHSDDSVKPVNTDSTTVEVIVSDGRMISLGSQWGHVAIEMDGTVYGISHKGYDVRTRALYLENNDYRDSIGVTLRVAPAEKEKMKTEFARRKKIGRPYDVISNSCLTNVADVLESIGILAHDPRFSYDPSSNAGVSPKELINVILRSKRFVKTTEYYKK